VPQRLFHEFDGPQIAESSGFRHGHEGGNLVLRARLDTGGVKRAFHQSAQSKLGRKPDQVLAGDIAEMYWVPFRHRMVITTHEDHGLLEQQPHFHLSREPVGHRDQREVQRAFQEGGQVGRRA
jgi:hypothetical protein